MRGASAATSRTRLDKAGYTVVATARRPETMADLPAALRLPLDVEKTESVAVAVDATLREFGRIDVLVNNAGYGQLGAIEEVSDELMHKVFEVNVHGPMRLVRAVVPHMRKQGAGRIINLSSLAGRVSIPVMGAYCATKFALEAISDALRLELAPFGIRVVVVEPGAIRTEFQSTARGSASGLVADPGSPYGGLYRAAEEFFGKSSRSAPGPEAVSRVIQRAIEARNPKARYQVPASAAVAARLLPFVSDALMDRVVGTLLKGGRA